jgi:hypothetical protein
LPALFFIKNEFVSFLKSREDTKTPEKPINSSLFISKVDLIPPPT